MSQHFTKALLHPRYWITWFGLGLLWIIVQLPYPALHLLGSTLGRSSRPFLKRRGRIADKNIEALFPGNDNKSTGSAGQKKFCFLGVRVDGNWYGLVLE